MTKDINNKKIVEYAMKFVGVPYKYGAKMSEAPLFFDCSGYIKYIYQHFGYDLPRSTIEQAEFAGRVVKSIKNIILGDLIFLHSDSGHYNKTFPLGIGHVVMYVGDNKVIHATSKRFKTYPAIFEKGSVIVSNIDDVMREKGSLIIIKRIIGK